ncbi:MAG: NSS family neurotransmitter:Na+ symporter [Halieaceae bacterium]|jgi:NSS family neurotransmitter:Na+ symporter
MAGSASAHWSSRFGFLMASVGFAVGLGNIWRFPYVTGENGGAAFVLVYLLCAFVIGVPILMAELMIGRRGGKSPPGSMREVATQEGESSRWQWAGGMNVLAAFLIEIVYCVIAGWVLLYLYKAVMTGFVGVDAGSATAAFDEILGSTGTMIFWTWTGLLITGGIIYAGVEKGIERAVTILMPTLFVLMVILVIFNMSSDGFGTAVTYLFSPDFSKINSGVWLAAVGQAFFSIGVAMAGMMIYGAYLPKSVSIGSSVVIVVIADTAVALLAGLVIFPAVFSYGLDPSGGPGLIFQTLPVAFAQMPGGHIFSVLFFLLLSVAAITSMVGLIEPMTAWLEEHKGFQRHKSAMAVLSVIGLLSLLSILSYNEIAELKIAGNNLNDSLDFFSNQVLLPLGGLLIAIFAGWFISSESASDELGMASQGIFKLWRFLIRWPVPAAITVIFVMGLAG